MAAAEDFEYDKPSHIKLADGETEVDAATYGYEEGTAEDCDDEDSDSWISLDDDDPDVDIPGVKTVAAAEDFEDAAQEEAEDAAAEEADVDISDIQVAYLDEVVNEEAEDNNEVSPGKYWTDLQHLELISSVRQMIDRYTPGFACYPRNQEEIGPDPSKQEESDESDWDPPVNPHPVFRKSRDPKKTPPKVI